MSSLKPKEALQAAWIPQAALLLLLFLPEAEGFSWLHLVLGLLAAMICLPQILRLRFKSYPWTLWLLGILLKWGFVAAIFSDHPKEAALFMLVRACWMLPMFIWGLRMQQQRPHGAVLAGLAGLSIWAIWQFSSIGKAASQPFFLDTNLLSAALVMTLPSAIASIFSNAGFKYKLPLIGFVLLSVSAILLFASRGAWLGLMSLAVLLPVYLLQHRWKKVLWLVGTLAAAGLMMLSAPKWGGKIGSTVSSITDTEHNFSNRERLMRWEIALRMSEADLITGIGPGQYPQQFKFWLQNRDEVERISYWNGWRLGAHNDSLTILAETGLPAALAWLALLALSIISVAFERGKSSILLALTAFMLMSCFNDLLDSGFITALLAINLGWAAQRGGN